jgi:hypothetical protein
MNKVFRLRDWVSLEEAAKQLTAAFQEEVTDIDILSLGLSGKIQLSIRLDVPTPTQLCRFITVREAKADPSPYADWEALRQAGEFFFRPSDDVYRPRSPEDSVYIIPQHRAPGPCDNHGLMDLTMMGDSEWVEVELQRRRGKTISTRPFSGAYVTESDGFGDDGELVHKGRPFKVLARSDSGFVDAHAQPPGSEIVLRPRFVMEFIESQTDIKKDEDLGTKERNSLLAIIGVLCTGLGHDISLAANASAVAKKLAKLADEQGIVISESTIEGHLKRVPDAVARKKR